MENITITASATFPTALVSARARTLGWDGESDLATFLQPKLLDVLTTFAAGDQIEEARQQVIRNIINMQAEAEQQVRDAVAPAISINIE